ncbi:hypothetical protein [Puia sp.]|jgi:hypothetical protein|uniref:ABC transporter permease/M1 family aminopeptidase n=1 Tax=Puia sp. TaxID=2045100 RepID=UPI002F424DFC
MFTQIFLFEIRYRLRRPVFYVYFFVILLLCTLGFAQGDLPVTEKEMFNAPAVLAEFFATCSIFLMLVSSAIMGTPLYRDLEHNTKEYYLSYPITKAGYFWGRFFGSFLFVLVISFAAVLGAWLGTLLGPVLGWQQGRRYGPNHALYYLQPYFTLIVPSLFFTSALFFGLVAVFRNVKVIYSSGLFLFLGYIIGNFFLHNIHNPTVIYLSDPFLINGLRSSVSGLSPDQLNHDLVPFSGLVLYNRIIWVSVGALVLAITWWRFSFERFFSGRASKEKALPPAPSLAANLPPVHIELTGKYNRRTLFSLARIEILNIIRDNYFWIILSGGYIFLSFVFWHGPGNYGVNDYPRTVFFVDAFNDIFITFLFVIIAFYTGETVHREKLTRFAFINDALPPSDRVLNSAKLLSLCALAAFLALAPVLLGLPIQLLKGYHEFNLAQYASSFFLISLPRLVVMVLFCYGVHSVVNNKFAGHGIAITIWILMLLAFQFNYFNYILLLYSYIPAIWASDMDGIGHMVKPIAAYQLYWLLGGLILIVLGSLFFARGVDRSWRERIRLARQRFHGATRLRLLTLLVLFLVAGGYIYYNVSYLNDYTTPWEVREKRALTERYLKRYAGLPLPHVTGLTMTVDLYPREQREETHAWVSVVNKTDKPIDSLLFDGDGLDYSLSRNGTPLAYTCPLYFPRGKFNLFRPAREASDYRVYRLTAPLQPGDSAQFQIHSTVAFNGFQNGLYAANALRNGILNTGNLPGLGYDEGDELGNDDIRRSHGLAAKKWPETPADDPVGQRTPNNQFNGDLVDYDLTVSTSDDHWVQSSGRLVKQYRANGRNYFHFIRKGPGAYPPVVIASARYSRLVDTIRLDNGHTVQMEIDYHPANAINLPHYKKALKEGMHYFSRAYGLYPYDRISLVETPAYNHRGDAAPGVIFISEPSGWSSDLRSKGTFDECYYSVAVQLAHQWWGITVMPNATLAAAVINSGLPHYAAFCLLAQNPDTNQLHSALEFTQWDNNWGHRTNFDGERPLLRANKWYQWDAAAALQLYALARRIGVDSLNAALHSFHEQWALRSAGPYPGIPDLYRTLTAHTPDTLRPWLAAAWEGSAAAAPAGSPAPPAAATTKPIAAARR